MGSEWVFPVLFPLSVACAVGLITLELRRARSTFVANRRPLPDDTFVRAFGTAPDDHDARLLLSIRRAIAGACKVPAEYILPNENPRKLHNLMLVGWDDLDIQLRLEIDLRVKLRRFDRDGFYESVRRGATVGNCIRRILPDLKRAIADPSARISE